VGNEGERLALTRLPTGVRVVTLVSRGKSVRGRCTHSSLVLRERAPALYSPSVGGRKNTANFVSEMFSEVHPSLLILQLVCNRKYTQSGGCVGTRRVAVFCWQQRCIRTQGG
jgi:hypothetical protein